MATEEPSEGSMPASEQLKLLNALLNLNGKVDGVEARHDRRIDKFEEDFRELVRRIDRLEQLVIDGFNRLETLNRSAIGFQPPSRE